MIERNSIADKSDMKPTAATDELIELSASRPKGITYAAATDAGIRKKTNQDSHCVRVAHSEKGQSLFAIVCDGVGGLSYGEKASAFVVETFSKWFSVDYSPKYGAEGFSHNPDVVASDWAKLIADCNSRIYAKAESMNTKIGTTISAILVFGEYKFVAINIGDSRVYWLRDGISQITKDHTAAQRAVAAGELSAEDARSDKRKNMLTRCVGTSAKVKPDFFKGKMEARDLVLLCSDGFCGKVSNMELYHLLSPFRGESSADMSTIMRDIVEIDKGRGEKDNITAILAKLR